MNKVGRISLTYLRDWLVVLGAVFVMSFEFLCLFQGSVLPCKWGWVGKMSMTLLLFLVQCSTQLIYILSTVDWAWLGKRQTWTLFCLCRKGEQERQLRAVRMLRHERHIRSSVNVQQTHVNIYLLSGECTP